MSPEKSHTEKNKFTLLLDFVNFCAIYSMYQRGVYRMKTINYTDFIKYVLGITFTNSFFWNLMYLCRGDLKQYEGPRSMDDLARECNSKWATERSKTDNALLLTFYTQINDPNIKQFLRGFFIVAPFVVGPCRLNVMFNGTNLWEDDCYEWLLADINNFADDPKLQYDLLTRVIDRISTRDKIQDYYNGHSYKISPRAKLIYERACFLRSNCAYSNTVDDPKIRNTKIQDIVVCMRAAPDANNKRQFFKQTFPLLIAEMRYALENSTPGKMDKNISRACQLARDVAGWAGAENMDLVEKVWTAFNTPTIMQMIRQDQKQK